MSAELLSLPGAVLDHLAQALILVLSVATLWLAPPVSRSDSDRRGRLLVTMVVIMAFCAGIDLLLRTAVMADVDPGQAWGFIPRVLAHSDYGFYWLWRAGIWLLLLAVAFRIIACGWSRLTAALLLIASLATMLLVSVTSHAGEDGLWSVINLVNWLHLVSISLWGGAVVTYALIVMSELRKQADPEQMAVTAERLSTLATAALVVVMLSGIFNSWQQMNTFSQLWSTDYGRVLVIKLVLVAIMMCIGALNRFHWVPKLAASCREAGLQWGASSSRLLQVLRVDSAVFLVILIVAVILGGQSPPAHGM